MREQRESITRRGMMAAMGGVAAAAILGASSSARAAEEEGSLIKNGRIVQGICPGVLPGNLEQKCQIAQKLGLKSIDLVGPDGWPTLKKYNLVGSMCRSHNLTKGLNHKENHEPCLATIRQSIEATAEAGFPNVICFSGNRAGISDDEGQKNCIEAMKQVAGLAEQKKVTLCMELLNSKVNHKDYQNDHTAWGAAVCKAVGSERVKLLYDIYHMQVQEGDVIATIRQYKDYIGHFHTAGVPGRHEIDETNELYYPAIMRAIADLGFKCYVCHEYSPARGNNALASLKKAIQICDV